MNALLIFIFGIFSFSAYAASSLDEAGSINNPAIGDIESNAINDQTPPNASFVYPVNGTTVSGIVNIIINVSDDKGLSKVQLALDGKIAHTFYIGVTSATLPYSWNVCPNDNKCSGMSSLKVTAYDTANKKTSAEITVTKTK